MGVNKTPGGEGLGCAGSAWSVLVLPHTRECSNLCEGFNTFEIMSERSEAAQMRAHRYLNDMVFLISTLSLRDLLISIQ